MPRSLRIQSTAKPKPSNLTSFMVFQRFSICHDCAAPLEMTEITFSTSSPAFLAKLMPSPRPCSKPAMQIWLTILQSWPAPGPPICTQLLA